MSLLHMAQTAKLRSQLRADTGSVGTRGDDVVLIPPNKSPDVKDPEEYTIPDYANIDPLDGRDDYDAYIDAEVDDAAEDLFALLADSPVLGLESMTSETDKLSLTVQTLTATIDTTYDRLMDKVSSMKSDMVSSGVVNEVKVLATAISMTGTVIVGMVYLLKKPNEPNVKRSLDGLIEKMTWPFGKVTLREDGRYRFGRLYVNNRKARSAIKEAVRFRPKGKPVPKSALTSALHDLKAALMSVHKALVEFGNAAVQAMMRSEWKWAAVGALLGIVISVITYFVIGSLRTIRHRLTTTE